MSEGEATAAAVFELLVATLLGAAAGWSLMQLANPLAAALAAGTGVLLALVVFGWARRDARRFRLPRFALPPFPELPGEPGEAAPASRASGVVVQFPVQPRPPVSGELDQRIRVRLDGGQRLAEVVPLRADASAALRDALLRLNEARR